MVSKKVHALKRINIAIDGYSGCGKSTLARDLAMALGYVFIDSGALYRGMTLLVKDRGTDITNASDIDLLLSTNPGFSFAPVTNHLVVNGVDVEQHIRIDRDIAQMVSDVAAVPQIRQYLKTVQEGMLIGKGVVMEGRDIGTVIMPGAELKLFITASIEVRVKRRLLDLELRGIQSDAETVRQNLQERDRKDATRKDAPLRMAEGAIAIDTSLINRQEQVAMVQALVSPLTDPGSYLPFIL